MSFTSKALRESLRPLAAKIRTMADLINAEARDFTAEEQTAWEAVNKDYNAIERRIVVLEQAEKMEAAMAVQIGDPAIGRQPTASPPVRGGDGAQLAVTHETRALAFNGWMRYQSGLPVSKDEEAAAEATGTLLRSSWYDIQRPTGMRQHSFWHAQGQPNFGATMSQFTGADGGYITVPETLVRSLEIALLQYGGVRQVAQVITTATGEPMTWPTANDTMNMGRRIGESATQTTTTTANPVFGQITWNAYAYTSDFILVPFGLLRDSAFNLAEIVGGMLGERVGRRTSVDFTTGTGASQPSGIVTDSVAGVTAASATAIAADEMVDLVHSVDPAYRSMGCGWMFHDNIFLSIRKMKDGNGNYLWQEGMSVGAPNMLLSYPYTINQQMASSIAASAKTMLFGLLSKYKIRDVGGFRLRRVDELFAVNDQVGFAYISYHDGHLLNANNGQAVGGNPVKHLVQAA